jgi:hypothetical protein
MRADTKLYKLLEAILGEGRCCDLLLLEVKYALTEAHRTLVSDTRTEDFTTGSDDGDASTASAGAAGASTVDGDAGTHGSTLAPAPTPTHTLDLAGVQGQKFHRDNLTATGNYYVFVALHDINSGTLLVFNHGFQAV